jgi:hypothetical protein
METNQTLNYLVWRVSDEPNPLFLITLAALGDGDVDDPGLQVGDTRHQFSLHMPISGGFGQFSIYILTLEE